MDSTFISIILTVLTVGVLWGAYELYQTRKWVEGLTQHAHYVFDRQMKDRGIMNGSPVVFDQEQP